MLTRDTLRPLLIADINALQANHYFLQSMLDFNSTPFTIGYGTQQARVRFARFDGETVTGSLSKDQFVLSLGGGRPATGFAAYGVLNFAGATAGDFPRAPITNQNSIGVRATHASFVAALGVAFHGFVLQYGWHYSQLRVNADQFGRLAHCGDQGYCDNRGFPNRPGAPNPVLLKNNKTTSSTRTFQLESQRGYSLAALLTDLAKLRQGATEGAETALAGLRLLAQPDFVEQRFGTAYGIGLNTYAKEIDYYGDKAAATDAAVQAGAPLPTRKHLMAEIPLVADRILGTGFLARIVAQVRPNVAPRLAEVGYIFTPDENADFVPHAGARAKLFRRGQEAEVGADAYAGFFWTITRSTAREQGRGLSLFATYAYNSPDASNFVPLPNAHVIGAQLVFGNPAALAPPVPSVEVPASARFVGDAS